MDQRAALRFVSVSMPGLIGRENERKRENNASCLNKRIKVMLFHVAHLKSIDITVFNARLRIGQSK